MNIIHKKSGSFDDCFDNDYDVIKKFEKRDEDVDMYRLK
jgi:hypothetical protein